MRNSALQYLGRYAATTSQFRRVMLRRIERSLAYHGGDRSVALEELDRLVEQLVAEGHLDDARYAAARAGDLHRRGTSLWGIRTKLRAKGLSTELIDSALASVSDEGEDPEMVSALAYARRRRLGPFRSGQEPDASQRRRELAAFARAGFPFGVAQRVVDARNEQEFSEHRE
ncbi:MAG: RecX family transcriptional regulator [Myxococcota bacterium]|nr:RecX family transcriptional regulator [Myxococcota bacterium]